MVRTGYGADGWQAMMIALNLLIQEVEMRYGPEEVYWNDTSGDEDVETTDIGSIFGGLTRVGEASDGSGGAMSRPSGSAKTAVVYAEDEAVALR